jgi:hypothetical protein
MHRLRNAIVDFHNAYAAYLHAGRDGDPKLRAAVAELVPAAQRGLTAAGFEPVLYPPRLVGRPVLHGLANMVFQHENSGAYRETPKWILDTCQVAAATLDDRIEAQRQRQKNPLFWLDSRSPSAPRDPGLPDQRPLPHALRPRRRVQLRPDPAADQRRGRDRNDLLRRPERGLVVTVRRRGERCAGSIPAASMKPALCRAFALRRGERFAVRHACSSSARTSARVSASWSMSQSV